MGHLRQVKDVGCLREVGVLKQFGKSGKLRQEFAGDCIWLKTELLLQSLVACLVYCLVQRYC